MSSLVLGVAGAAVGFMVGGPTGAQIGWGIGSMIGSSLTSLPDIQGARLSDLKMQVSTYGAMRPILYGTNRVAGNVVWASDLIETSHEEEAGGKGGPSQSVTTYSYSIHAAVALCEGQISGVRRIWANGDLIMDASTSNTGITGQSGNIRIYSGSETQVADSLLEAYLGAGNVPGYRGTAYVVFENLQLEKYGNRLPNLSFEVVADGAFSAAAIQYIDDITTQITSSDSSLLYHHPLYDGILLMRLSNSNDLTMATLHVVDVVNKTTRIIPLGRTVAQMRGRMITYVDSAPMSAAGQPLLVDPLRELWLCCEGAAVTGGKLIAIALNPDTYAITREIIVPSTFGAFLGKMHYDKWTDSVIFATNTTSISDAINLVHVRTLAVTQLIYTGAFNQWFTYGSIMGNTTLAMRNYAAVVDFFKEGRFIAEIDAGSHVNAAVSIGYDASRQRFFWIKENTTNSITFRVVDEVSLFVTDFVISLPFTITLSGFSLDLSYFKSADKVMLTAFDGAGFGQALFQFNADTFSYDTRYSTYAENHAAIELPYMPEYIGTVTITTRHIALIPLTDRLAPNQVALSGIVSNLCARSGLMGADIDVTQLTDMVDGYAVGQQMSARAAIEGLMPAYYFDAVESD